MRWSGAEQNRRKGREVRDGTGGEKGGERKERGGERREGRERGGERREGRERGKIVEGTNGRESKEEELKVGEVERGGRGRL